MSTGGQVEMALASKPQGITYLRKHLLLLFVRIVCCQSVSRLEIIFLAPHVIYLSWPLASRVGFGLTVWARIP